MPRVITNNGYDDWLCRGGRRRLQLPIVFLHGVGSDKSVWHPQLAHFGGTRRTIAFDYPGYGDSDPAPEGTTRDDYASAIISAMHELGVDRAHICGLSLGGVVAIAMHHAAPDRCASLILADTFAAHPEGRAIYERSHRRQQRPCRQWPMPASTCCSPSQPTRRSAAEVVETMSRIDPAAYRIGAEAVWLADQRDRAAAIDVPTLVLVRGPGPQSLRPTCRTGWPTSSPARACR